MKMVQLMLDPQKLLRFAHAQGHRIERDEDSGYATHAWLAASFGTLAPKPFRLLERRARLELLGYCDNSHEELRAHAELYADPLALTVCHWEQAASKPMPPQWRAGQRLGFEVRACPVSRGQTERDVFLAALERARTQDQRVPDRASRYLEWLRMQMGTAVHLQHSEIAGFRRIRLLRRSRSNGALRAIERPDALFCGELQIADPQTFQRLLARGVGRHRAFGFGMLLLRPPR